ncbi:MAG: helix-turn-helix domain-containing protein [Cyanobacteriota bacterium]
MENFRVELAKKLKNLRQSLNITQAEAAKAISLNHPKAISQIESADRNITAEELLKLSHLFQKDITYFYGVESSNDPNLSKIIDTYHLSPRDHKNLLSKLFQIMARGVQLSDSLDVLDESKVVEKDDKSLSKLIGKLNLNIEAKTLEITSNKIVLAGDMPTRNSFKKSKLKIIDVSNPAVPRLLNTDAFSFDSSVEDIKILANLVYVAGKKGLIVIDASNDQELKEITYLPELANATSLELVSNRAYVATTDDERNSTLHIMDTTIPTKPTILSKINLPGTIEDVEVDNHLCIVAAGNEGVLLVDCSDSKNPVLVSSCAQIRVAVDIEVVKMYGHKIAIIASGYDGIKIMDYMNNKNPRVIGEINIGLSLDIEIIANLAFVAGRGLSVIDFSDPKNPVLKEIISDVYASSDIELAGDIVYVAERGFGLKVVKTKPF